MLIYFVDSSENLQPQLMQKSVIDIGIIEKRANLNGKWPLTDVCLKCPVDLDTYYILREVRYFSELTSVK